jgi:hypothetical protein
MGMVRTPANCVPRRGRILLLASMPLPRRQKRLLFGTVLVLALLGVYAALGYLAAPSLVRKQLVERAAAAGYDLRVGAIATHPFLLVVDAYDVQLSTREGRPLALARRASVDLAWSSLWRRAWVLDRVAVESGTLELPNAPRLEALRLEARELATRDAQAGAFSASANLASGGTLRTQGKVSLAPLAVSGELQLADASLAEAWHYLPDQAGEAPRGSLRGSLQYRYAGGELALSQASAQARLASGGSLQAAGELAFSPFSADLRLQAQALPISLAQPLLAGRTQVVLRAGALSGQGRLRLGARASYDGSATISAARVDGPQGELGGWESLSTEHLHVGFSPFSASAGELLASAPHVRVAIGPDGELNLARAFAGGAESAAGSPAELKIARLVVERGKLDFSDRSLDTPFATSIESLSGALSQLSTRGDEPARVELAGRVGRYGEARVRGAIDLTAPAARTDLQLTFRNLALPEFTPYAAKFAGYRIEAGRLDAHLRYRVRDGRMVGENQLAFDRLKLGEKVQSASLLDLPLDLAVALLTDAEGRIDLAIPVRGDLRDPKIDLGGLIAQALRNTLGRIVSAPFRLIASLLGRPNDAPALDEVRFAAGSADLAPPEEETLAARARALGERPRVGLAIHGGYDPENDRQALARARLLGELARRAGYGAAAGGSAPAGIDSRDPKIRNAAERLFLERGGQAVELSALEPRRGGYGRRLLDALAAKSPLAPDAAQALARRRAEAVRDALVKRGIDAARVTLAGPERAKAGEEGVPTALDLRAGRSSPAALKRDLTPRRR